MKKQFIVHFLKKKINSKIYSKIKFFYHLIIDPKNIVRKLKENLNDDMVYNEKLFNKLNFNISIIRSTLEEHKYNYFDDRISWHYHLFAGLSTQKKDIKILEIGTYLGEFTNFLSKIFPYSEIATCDLKSTDINFISSYDRDSEDKLSKFLEIRKNNLDRKNIKFLEIDSFNLLDNFSENSFDLIWIDGDHNNPQVTFDIFQSLRLLKTDGLMICDDIIKKNNQKFRFSNESYLTLKYLDEKKIVKSEFIFKRVTSNYKDKKYISISKKII